MFYNNIFTWDYFCLKFLHPYFLSIFLQLNKITNLYIHRRPFISDAGSFLCPRLPPQIMCGRFFSILPTIVKAKVKQACLLTACAWAVLRTAESDPLQPLRTTRRLWISNCTASLSTDQLNLFHFRLTYTMKHVIGYAFCIISNLAQICIVNKSICHFNCWALSQLTELRGQTKHNKWLHVQILSQGAELNNLWAQSVLLSYELALPPE